MDPKSTSMNMQDLGSRVDASKNFKGWGAPPSMANRLPKASQSLIKASRKDAEHPKLCRRPQSVTKAQHNSITVRE